MIPLVSVNIPTYNSGTTLEDCLRSIADQNYPSIETLVIDSESDDDTLAIAKKYDTKIFSAGSLSEARLEGIRRSRGDYIFLVDSDQIVGDDVVRRCVDSCQREQFDAITLFERSMIKMNTFAERVVAYDKWLIHVNRDDDVNLGAAIPRFFKADVLKGVNIPRALLTFDHNIIYSFALQRQSQVGFLDAYIYHHEPSTWSEIARKFFRYGQHYVAAFRVSRRLVAFHSMPRRAYFSRNATKDPALFGGLAILYTLKALAAMCGATTSILEEARRIRH